MSVVRRHCADRLPGTCRISSAGTAELGLYQPTYSIESPDYIRAVVTGPADDKNILKPTMLKKAGDCTL